MMTPWTEWEDWKGGMYALRPIDPEIVERSRALLSSPDQFLEVAIEMVRAWPAAATHNLVLLKSGRAAWVGQASCCYSVFATSGETRRAWGLISTTDQVCANAVAAQVIDGFRREVVGGAETLFTH